jgi:hypothetical protein
MIPPIFVFLSLPWIFYSVCAIILIIMASYVEAHNDNYFSNWFIPTALSGFLLYIIGNHYGITLNDITNNLSYVIYALIMYIVIGIIWSFAKWYFYLIDVRDKFIEARQNFVKDYSQRHIDNISIDTLTQPLVIGSDNYHNDLKAVLAFHGHINTNFKIYQYFNHTEISQNSVNITDSIKPIAAKHKSKITQWIAFWPISGLWTLINDPIRKLVNVIFSRIKNTFQRLSNHIFKGV